METYATVSEDIKEWIDAKAEVVQIILTRIDNDIYSTVDACPNSMEIWKAIKRLKQECQRFVTLVKQSQELKTVSYHKLYDILNQHHNEVNEIRAERLARTDNPLALVAQQQPVYYPQPNPTHYAQSSNPTQYTQNSSTRSQAATRNKGKETANSLPLIYDPEPEVVVDDEASLKEKEIDKLMALISMSFKKIFKPTNNNLRTSSNTRNVNVDNTLRYNRRTGYDRQTGQYDNQRTVNVVGARENVGTQVMQQTGIQCLYCNKFGHVGREYEADWRDNTDDEPEDQELEAHYMYMAKIQEVNPEAADNSGPIFNAEPL
ncbi:hypothetical protein Tco_0967041 [Tanacetum coccineum]